MKRRENIKPKNRDVNMQHIEFEQILRYPAMESISELKIQIPEVYCKHFGCGKLLNLSEKLTGFQECEKHLILHNNEKKQIDVLKYINF